MTQEFFAFAGVLSAVFSVGAFVPYILDTWRGTTRPERATWFIWSILSSLSFATNSYAGAVDSLWFVGAQAGSTVLIFILSLRHGVGGLVKKEDRRVLVAAAFGILLWAMNDNPIWALGISIGVSFLGATVTIAKAYRAPDSETLSTWLISVLAAGLGVVSVGGTDPILLAYPLYLLALYGGIVVAIGLGRRCATSLPKEFELQI